MEMALLRGSGPGRPSHEDCQGSPVDQHIQRRKLCADVDKPIREGPTLRLPLTESSQSTVFTSCPSKWHIISDNAVDAQSSMATCSTTDSSSSPSARVKHSAASASVKEHAGLPSIHGSRSRPLESGRESLLNASVVASNRP